MKKYIILEWFVLGELFRWIKKYVEDKNKE
jgi:hypothetical protein